MSRRRLVCASCAQAVDLGRCPTCRRVRAQQRQPGGPGTPAPLWLLLLALVAAALLGGAVRAA